MEQPLNGRISLSYKSLFSSKDIWDSFEAKRNAQHVIEFYVLGHGWQVDIMSLKHA